MPGRIRAERACGATGKTTFEDSYDRGGGAVPTMWAGGVACPSGPSRPVSGGRGGDISCSQAARQVDRSSALATEVPCWVCVVQAARAPCTCHPRAVACAFVITERL